jgi:hypothetical protein
MWRASFTFAGMVWSLQAGTLASAQEQLCGSLRQTVDACSGGTIEQHNYPNNAGCERTLSSSAPGSSIRLDFRSFSVESHFDWLEVFDGDSSASPQIGRFTGTDIPAGVTSSGSDLTLRLTSDSSVSSSGFVASMACTTPIGCDAVHDPTHGTAAACAALAHGATCQLQCDEGFTDLDVSMVCSSGTLSSVLPTCARDCRHLSGMDNACPVSADGEISLGNVEQSGTIVYFAFDATAGVTYQLDVDIHGLPGGISDTVMSLYDVNGNQLAVNDDGLAPDEENTGCGSRNEEGCASFIEWVCPANGVYYAAVRHYGSGTGTFSFSALAVGHAETVLPPQLQPDSPALQLSTACFLGSVLGTLPSCTSTISNDRGEVERLGSGSSFVVTIDAVAGATFDLNLAIDPSGSLRDGNCVDIGRADGLGTAFCGRAHCPDFAPGAQSATQGMCDATCGFCDRSIQTQLGLYATVAIFPEHAVGGSSEAGKAVWPNSELAVGQWEFSPTAHATKTCLRGDWFCFFPGASDFQDHASFRWVASGTGRFAVVVRPNCNVPAAAYPPSQRVEHKLVCETSWSLSVRTPMMVTTEYNLGGANSIGGNAAAIIGEAVGVEPTTVDVFSNLLAREAIVHIHTADLVEAERVHDELVRHLEDSSSRLHIQLLDINGVDAGSHKVCIVAERHVVEREVVVTDQDPCVLDATTECHAQLMQMFERRVLPVSAFATGFRPLSQAPRPLPNGNEMLAVAVDIGLRALTQTQGSSTIQDLERQTGSSTVTIHGQGPGHRRLQASDAHDDHSSTLWCVDRAAAVDAACCTDDDDDVDCTDGMPSSCDFACALSFIPYYEACGDMFDEAMAGSLMELYAKCQVAAIGDGSCERVSIVQPPVVSTGEEVTVEVSLTAPDTDGETTLDLTLGLQQITLETTAEPCVLQGNNECAAQLARMFVVNQPGYGTHPLKLEMLPQLPSSSPASHSLSVRVSVSEHPCTHKLSDFLHYRRFVRFER